MTRPLRVFLCHASQDKPAVWRLYRYLKQHGVQPWLDQEDLIPGQNWAVEISKALDASDVILVCLSKNSISKEGFVQKEISFALDKALEKPEGMIFIIPVKLEECDIPRSLSRYHWVDLFREGGRKRLLMGLNRRATELGEEVTAVIMDDTKQRTPKPLKELSPEEPVNLLSSEEKVEEEFTVDAQINSPIQNDETIKETLGIEVDEKIQKEEPFVESSTLLQDKTTSDEIKPKTVVEKKPYTKILDPSSLNPSQSKENKQVGRKSIENNNLRWFGIGGFIFIGLLIVLFSRNYLPNDLTPTASPTITFVPTTSTPELTETPIPTPTFGIGSIITSEKDGMTLVYVPAGEFTMGSENGEADEKPEHQVNLDAFWIDQTEVTNAMYAQCVGANQCKLPVNINSDTHSNYYGNSEFDNFPVIYVSWDDAKTYCEWAGRRLPTEAEWEKAARGTAANIYPWGNTFDGTKVNFCDSNCQFGHASQSFDDGYADVSPVGSYSSGESIYGALDMAGNIREWVSSLFQPYPYDPKDGRENLSSLGNRVLRGGSWNYTYNGVRSVYRNQSEPVNSAYNGFRCSRSP